MKQIQLNDNDFTQEPKNSKKRAIGIAFALAVFVCVVTICVILAIPSTENNTYLTLTNFNQIQNNMTYQEVVLILDGHEGVLETSSSYEGYTLEYYNWSSSNSSKIIIVGFQNGRVIAKSQVGLR